MAAIKRIQKEIRDMQNSKTTDIPENISAGPIDKKNLFKWVATIVGAVGTEYEGGLFKLSINIPNNYPFSPPVVMFDTKIFHPNISLTGTICLDILKYHWSPSYTIMNVLLSLQSLMSDPNVDDPLNAEAAQLYKQDKGKYIQVVQDYVNKYAI